MADANLTAERLREILDYDPETGIFRWKVKKVRNEVGAIAGGIHKNSGYVQIVWDLKRHTAHRLAWLYVHGHWPSVIDHINGDRADNRISNLRNVTTRVNSQNRRGPQRNKRVGTSLGVTGTGSKRNPWMAMLKVGDKSKYLGSFPTEELAYEAFLTAKRQLHAGCTI